MTLVAETSAIVNSGDGGMDRFRQVARHQEEGRAGQVPLDPWVAFLSCERDVFCEQFGRSPEIVPVRQSFSFWKLSGSPFWKSRHTRRHMASYGGGGYGKGKGSGVGKGSSGKGGGGGGRSNPG